MNSKLRKNKTLNSYEEETFLTLINSNQEKLYRIAYSYVKNKDDALDIVQEAVYKAYISYNKLKDKKYQETWLVRILINTALDSLKKKKKVVNLDLSTIENITIDDNSDDINKKLDIEDALNSLNEKQRTVIVLKYFEDMKFDDIAKVLDCPISTVKSTLYRALKIMKINLKE